MSVLRKWGARLPSIALSLFAAVNASPHQSQSGSVAAEQPASASSTAAQARRAELLRQLREIEQRIQREGDGRVRYISLATEDEPFKSYYTRLVERIEALGTANFPKRAGESVYGKVLLHVSIQASGRVQDVEIVRSDDPFLSRHAVKTLRSAGRLESFPPEMKKLVDRVVISTGFTYERQ
ncbi:energy transducer TonB [Aquabacterium humicola]|uniref:energy transducer TonB n=1 Tax=Aquabacterium humicola TaxID=3237377 RepID=UPI002542AEBF|nr:TonB family protein [Rubrivivax pictus]